MPSVTRTPPTVGIVGLGFGRAHIPAFQANGCPVVAVCQRDERAARAAAERYGVPRVFTQWEEMLDRARPDIVVIATPPHLHHAIAMQALAAGAHVLCEKPLAMDAGQARAMAEAARRAGRVAMTCFNWRFPAGMQRLHALVEEGAIGRVFHAHLRYFGSRWADETTPATWRVDRAQGGHGAMGDLGVHLVDLARWHFGEFARVCALGGIAYPSRTVPGGGRAADAEDYCAVLGELISGTQVTLSVSRAARGSNEQTVEAFGTRGALAYRLRRGRPGAHRGELEAALEGKGFVPVPVRAPWPRGAGTGDLLEVTGKSTIAPLVRQLIQAIRSGSAASPSFEDGMRAQAVLDAVRESAVRGQWVPVRDPGDA